MAGPQVRPSVRSSSSSSSVVVLFVSAMSAAATIKTRDKNIPVPHMAKGQF